MPAPTRSATPVTVDTVAPTAPSITSIAENGGGGINAGEAANGTPVVVGLAGTGAAAGDTLTVNWGSQTVSLHAPGGRHLGQQRDGDGAGRDDHGAGQRHVQRDGPADRRGGQCRRQLDGDFPVTVDTVAPTAPSITSITENSGGGINAGEASNGTPVVVGLTGTGAVAGNTLTVNWGSQTSPTRSWPPTSRPAARR